MSILLKNNTNKSLMILRTDDLDDGFVHRTNLVIGEEMEIGPTHNLRIGIANYEDIINRDRNKDMDFIPANKEGE